jgi:hypothetical protein
VTATIDYEDQQIELSDMENRIKINNKRFSVNLNWIKQTAVVVGIVTMFTRDY